MNFDIESLKRKMLIKYPFFGSIVANVTYEEVPQIGTAATDGKKIIYNPKFLNELSKDEQVFVFAHEVSHIAFNHILRSEGKDKEVWNIATDAVINAFLQQDGLKLAKGGIDIPEAINYDAEDLYEKMLKEKQNNNSQNGTSQGNDSQNNDSQNGTSQGNDSQNNDSQNGKSKGKNTPSENGNGAGQSQQSNGMTGHASHELWPEAVEQHKKEVSEKNEREQNKKDKVSPESDKNEKKKDNASSNNEKKDENNNSPSDNEEIAKKQKETEKLGEKKSFQKNSQERKQALEELKDMLSRESSQPGNDTNGSIRSVSNIGKSKPILDWRYVLKEAIKYEVDWSYKNATIENGVVCANLEEQPMPETEILLDTSGSINPQLLKNFLRECKNILKQSKVKVGCFDTRFYDFKDIRTEKDIDNMEFRGGGGTNFDVAVNAFSNRVENKIIFTDGEASMPKKVVDAVWIVFGGRKINPPGGKVIYISDADLKRLYSYVVEDNSINNHQSKVRKLTR